MRCRVVLKYVGQLCIVLAALTACPLAVAWSFGDGQLVLRLAIVLLAYGLLRMVIVRTCLAPHAEFSPRLWGRRLHPEELQHALLVILLFVAFAVLSWLPFVVAGYSPLDALFEVVSATGTVGLSVGITSHHLPGFLKGVLCADMLLGRLEIIAWLVLLYPGTWFGERMRHS